MERRTGLGSTPFPLLFKHKEKERGSKSFTMFVLYTDMILIDIKIRAMSQSEIPTPSPHLTVFPPEPVSLCFSLQGANETESTLYMFVFSYQLKNNSLTLPYLYVIKKLLLPHDLSQRGRVYEDRGLC